MQASDVSKVSSRGGLSNDPRDEGLAAPSRELLDLHAEDLGPDHAFVQVFDDSLQLRWDHIGDEHESEGSRGEGTRN